MKLGAMIATLENLEEVTAEEPVQAAETATETAELGGELQADETQIEGADTGIEDAGVAAGQIDELTEVAEDSLVGEGEQVPEAVEGEAAPVGQEGEGLSEGEATLIEISHESIMSSIGFPVERRTYTAESFGSKRSKREVTMEALDKLKESAGKIKDNVIRALKAAFEAVVGFVTKLLANRALMEKHLANLAARVQAVTTDTKKAETLQAGAAMLSINGQADANTAVKVLQGADQILVVAKKVAEMLYVKRDLEDGAALGQEISAAVKGLPANGEGAGILGGGKAFKTNIGNADMNSDGVKDNAGFTLEVVDAGKNAEQIAAPNKAQMGQVIKAAQGVLTNLREAEKIRSRLKDFVAAAENQFNRAVGVVQAKVGTEGSKAAGAEKRDLYAATAVGRKVMTKLMTTSFGNAFKVVKASADYVQAGLKNLGAVASAPAAAAA